MIVVYVVAALVAMIAIVIVVGMALPQNHVAARSARYSKPPAEVFAIISDVRALPTWNPATKKVEIVSEANGLVSWKVDGNFPVSMIERDPPRKLVTKIGPGLPFGGTWTYELAADGAGTRLTITERGEVYNPFFRFVSKFLMGHTKSMDVFLSALAKKLGDTITIT